MSSQSSSSSSLSPSTLTRATLTGLANLIKLVPTGTMFVFLTLSPILTNIGQCSTANKYLSTMLIALCGLSCVFATFTDSYTDEEGNKHYGIVTTKGLWPCNNFRNINLSSYKLRVGDFVHAGLSLFVFGIVSLLDRNVVECFYPTFELMLTDLMEVLPLVAGVIASVVFGLFPCTRNGIGYPTEKWTTPLSSTSV